MNQYANKSDFQWVLCPSCQAKTRIMIRSDTILINFPLFCPKCKQTFLISIQHGQLSLKT